MINVLPWPLLRLVERLGMSLTMGCCIYIIIFILGNHAGYQSSTSQQKVQEAALVQPLPLFEGAMVATPSRDIFSLASSSGVDGMEITPKGYLPSHLKIVGIVIADQPQIIIEDNLLHQTYFIDAKHPQAGIKLSATSPHQIVINYQGQDIRIPVERH